MYGICNARISGQHMSIYTYIYYILYIYYTYEIDKIDINIYILRGRSIVCFVDSFGPRTSYRTRQGCLKRNLKNHQKTWFTILNTLKPHVHVHEILGYGTIMIIMLFHLRKTSPDLVMNRGSSGLLALNLNGSRASFDAQAGHRAATPGFPGAKLLRADHVHG